MNRHAEVPITIVREGGVVREVWAEDANGHCVPLAITGFDLNGRAHEPGDVSLHFHAGRVRIEDR